MAIYQHPGRPRGKGTGEGAYRAIANLRLPEISSSKLKKVLSRKGGWKEGGNGISVASKRRHTRKKVRRRKIDQSQEHAF